MLCRTVRNFASSELGGCAASEEKGAGDELSEEFCSNVMGSETFRESGE